LSSLADQRLHKKLNHTTTNDKIHKGL